MREYRIGDIIEGEVSGIQNYGVFVKLDEETQGLVHISECKNGFVDDLDSFIKVGEKVTVIIIDIDEYSHKLSLSIRALDDTCSANYPARMKHPPKRRLPHIGFKTLDKMMPKIIQEGLNMIEDSHVESINKGDSNE